MYNFNKNAFQKTNRIVAILFLILQTSFVSGKERGIIDIPDIMNYYTLKCDFHTHTIFSDATEWPTVRVDEAWVEGLDAVVIADHVEYHKYKEDVVSDLNRPYAIAKPLADELGIILIQGGEITRSMPPGHWNAIFLSDVNALKVDDWRDAMQEAMNQNAFIFWNHPGWKGQQPDGVSCWYDEHTELYDKGVMMGIELVNSFEYYPQVFRWCIEKNLTFMANSDIHNPIAMSYDIYHGEHRPITLVFAKERNAESIHEALLDHRTAVYWNDTLMANEKYLQAIFKKSIEITDSKIKLNSGKKAYVQITNNSDVPFNLKAGENDGVIDCPSNIILSAHHTTALRVNLESDKNYRGQLQYSVTNLLVEPDRGIDVSFPIILIIE